MQVLLLNPVLEVERPEGFPTPAHELTTEKKLRWRWVVSRLSCPRAFVSEPPFLLQLSAPNAAKHDTLMIMVGLLPT